jgi:hypothetical protein
MHRIIPLHITGHPQATVYAIAELVRHPLSLSTYTHTELGRGHYLRKALTPNPLHHFIFSTFAYLLRLGHTR